MIEKRKGTKRNLEINKKLKEVYSFKNINYCELFLGGCARTWTLAFAHRRKRIEYVNDPDLAATYAETVIACTPCHQIIEGNKKLTEEMFNHLRPSTVNDEWHKSLKKRGYLK